MEKSLLCDPGSELRLGGRENRSAKIINRMEKKKRKNRKKVQLTRNSGAQNGTCFASRPISKDEKQNRFFVTIPARQVKMMTNIILYMKEELYGSSRNNRSTPVSKFTRAGTKQTIERKNTTASSSTHPVLQKYHVL